MPAATKRRKPTTRRVSPSQLRKYDDKFLDCRLQHNFKTVGFFRTSDGYTRRRLECQRCKALGTDTFTALGERAKPRQYVLPVGYTLPGGAELTDIRREVMRRATIFPNETALLAAVVSSNGHRKAPAKTTKVTKKRTYAVRHQPKKKVGAR